MSQTPYSMGHSLNACQRNAALLIKLTNKLLVAGLFTADGPKVYGLKLLECGQLPLSLSHKNLNTVYINYSLEISTLKSYMGL